MGAVPVAHVFAVGELATAANINNNTVSLAAFLLSPPRFRGRQTVAQSIPNTTPTGLSLDAEDYDTDAAHSTISNTSRVVGKTPGWHQCAGVGRFTANATGTRRLRWAVNGTAVNGSDAQIEATGTTAAIVVTAVGSEVFLNGTTDYVELQAIQTSGGALNTNLAADERQPMVTTRWVSS